MIKIIGVGDIMPGGLLNGRNIPCADGEVQKLLAWGDVRCGTLECAFGDDPTYDEAKVADRGNVIYAKNEDISRLTELHIDIVSLANNHFFDLGPDGAEHTMKLLDREGIPHCGAGRNLEEAGKPVVKEISGKKIAFLGFCDTNYKNVYYCTYATRDTPGVNPMTNDYVESEIKKYAALYDYIVVLAHWGSEHTFNPNDSTERMAKLMLKAGANLILGSHPHRIQSVINTREGSVAYSMGNFLFPERLIAPPKVTWYPDGEIDYTALPVTNEYPIVDRVTLKTLPFLARVGMIVESKLDGEKVMSDYTLTYLNKNNTVELLSSVEAKPLRKTLARMGRFLKWDQYHLYILLIRYRTTIARRLRKAINNIRKNIIHFI